MDVAATTATTTAAPAASAASTATATPMTPPLAAQADRALFLVWGPPSHGPRSKVMSRELGIPLRFVEGSRKRGLLAAPVKYPRQALATLVLLARRRPTLLFVQSPPSFAPLLAAVYGKLRGARVVVDAHSDAMQSPRWTRPRFLYRWLARNVAVTIVTNETFATELEAVGGNALVLRDVPTRFPEGGEYPLGDGFHVVAVSTFAPDEPVTEVFEAARRLEGVTFHMTGNPARADQAVLAERPDNVVLTGFLPDETYYALLRGADTVMCLTLRDNTMQRGACEALSLGKPIVTSDWALLRDYFADGTLHVDNTAEGIRAAIEQLRADYAAYEAGIGRLQVRQQQEWARALEALLGFVGEEPAGERRRRLGRRAS